MFWHSSSCKRWGDVVLRAWGMAGHPTPPMQIIEGVLSFLLKIFYFIFLFFRVNFVVFRVKDCVFVYNFVL